MDGSSQGLCRCGHPEQDHYQYSRNGQMVWICSGCDPMARLPAGDYGADQESYIGAMMVAAMHAYDPAEDARPA